MRSLSILRKPYPFPNQNAFWLKVAFLIGGLVFLILFFIFSFQNNAEINLQLFRNTFLFGLVTSFCLGFFTLLLPNIFKYYFSEPQWTVGKNILLWGSVIVVITIANIVLARQLYNLELSIKVFYRFFYYTVGISFINVAFINLINYKRLLKINFKITNLINEEINSGNINEANVATQQHSIVSTVPDIPLIIAIVSENEKEKTTFSMDELLYVESASNYCKFFCYKNAQLKSSIIRTTLKSVEQQLSHPHLYRCHRSYIVNLTKIVSVSGNAQGYQLQLDGIEETIPVARTSGKELLERLQQLK